MDTSRKSYVPSCRACRLAARPRPCEGRANAQGRGCWILSAMAVLDMPALRSVNQSTVAKICSCRRSSFAIISEFEYHGADHVPRSHLLRDLPEDRARCPGRTVRHGQEHRGVPASTRRSSSSQSCACRRSTTAPSACRSISTCRGGSACRRRSSTSWRPGTRPASSRTGNARRSPGPRLLTRLADRSVPDEAYGAVRRHFSEDEVIALSVAVANINAWNRLGRPSVSRRRSRRRRRKARPPDFSKPKRRLKPRRPLPTSAARGDVLPRSMGTCPGRPGSV